MNGGPRFPARDGDDEVVTRLLHLAGHRAPVPAERAERVRSAVQAEWRAATARRATRRKVLAATGILATAAGLVLVAGPLWRIAPDPAASGELVAVVERIEGVPRRSSESAGGVLAPLAADDGVRTGEWIETVRDARVALRFLDGTSVRLDAGSRARPISARAIELQAGAVYVDTGRETGRFEVRTPLATARDVGTQFELRLLEGAVRLRVRTGIVELVDRRRSVTGNGGTEITLSDAGAVSRPLRPHGPEWDWTTALSPSPAFDGARLADFLGGVAREQGWTVDYADPGLAREAAGIVLHGSVDGLSPREAIEVAVAASGLDHRLGEGKLIVTRPADGR